MAHFLITLETSKPSSYWWYWCFICVL